MPERTGGPEPFANADRGGSCMGWMRFLVRLGVS